MIKRFEDFVKDLSLKTESKQKDVEKESKVKVDDEHKYLAGVKEVIEIVGLGKMKVKLDSGNSSLCSFSSVKIELNNLFFFISISYLIDKLGALPGSLKNLVKL